MSLILKRFTPGTDRRSPLWVAGRTWCVATAWILLLAGCGTDDVAIAQVTDTVSAGDSSVDDAWKPTPKDIQTSSDAAADGTSGSDSSGDASSSDTSLIADTANQADGADGTSVSDTVVLPPYVQDAGGGLPNYVKSIDPTTFLFDPVGIHEIKFTVAPAAWTAYLDGVNKPDGKQVYDWATADVDVDGIVYKNLGIRGFGNGSQLSNPAKPNIRLKFDKFNVDAMGPQGQKAFRLKAAGQDDTFIREPLAGAMLRSIGGEAPKFSWAHVTVNGEDYGPYILQESVDKRFFLNHFGNNDGQKFEVVQSCMRVDCPGGNCGALKTFYEGDPGDVQNVVTLAQAIQSASDADLPAVLDQYFVLDELLADYAVDATLSNLDGFAGAGQNFTFYMDEKTLKFHLIATGTDLTFGYFGDAWYSLQSPWGKPNSWCTGVDKLYQRIWSHPVMKLKLQEKFKQLQCGMFKEETLLLLVNSYEKALAPWILNDPKGNEPPEDIAKSYKNLRTYIHDRQQTLVDLVGECK